MFLHCVYFWLKDDLSPNDVAAFERGVKSLTTIETVRHGFVGTPASTDRPVIDRTYSYGLVCAFDDKDDHDAYQVHPVHDDFRNDCSRYWTDVKIYDFLS
ncbi:MAG TPA: Dabb family protein [Rhodothermales bacterium]|nr:Dabb family protein [Rhodothermales bacterium]